MSDKRHYGVPIEQQTSEELSGEGPSARSSASFPTEAGRWYARDGSSVNTVIGKNGNPRATTITDARKLDLVPSVTSILRITAKPGLEAWKLREMMEVAYTTPRQEGETDDEFFDKVIFESREKGRLAAERGTELHGAIEKFIAGEIVPTPWGPHVVAVRNALSQYGIELTKGKPEHSFASPLGYGGKIDWHDDKVIIDLKSKDEVTNKKKLAYPEHCWQLAAYDQGINSKPGRRLINAFVGAADAAVRIHEWSSEDAQHGWLCFEALLNFWKLTNNL